MLWPVPHFLPHTNQVLDTVLFHWRQYLQAGGKNEKNEGEKETVAFLYGA